VLWVILRHRPESQGKNYLVISTLCRTVYLLENRREAPPSHLRKTALLTLLALSYQTNQGYPKQKGSLYVVLRLTSSPPQLRRQFRRSKSNLKGQTIRWVALKPSHHAPSSIWAGNIRTWTYLFLRARLRLQSSDICKGQPNRP
jgi:hypothetical protein